VIIVGWVELRAASLHPPFATMGAFPKKGFYAKVFAGRIPKKRVIINLNQAYAK